MFVYSYTVIGTHLQDVVAVRVTQVPAANLGAHVPAIEWCCSELQAPAVEQHVGDSWQDVPP